MTTDYLVKCPHMNCHWFGSLPATFDDSVGCGTTMNVSIVAFQCPRCRQIWPARLIGDDLETLPLEEDDDLAGTWPDVDLGMGD